MTDQARCSPRDLHDFLLLPTSCSTTTTITELSEAKKSEKKTKRSQEESDVKSVSLIISPRRLCYGWAGHGDDTLCTVNVAIASKSAMTVLRWV